MRQNLQLKFCAKTLHKQKKKKIKTSQFGQTHVTKLVIKNYQLKHNHSTN